MQINRFFLCLLLPVSMFAQNTFPSSGNVGIGTTNPSRAIEINQTVSDRAFLIRQPNNSQQIVMHLANNSAGQYGYLNLGGDTKLRGSGFRSSFGGSLGIGTPNPSAKLDIKVATSESSQHLNFLDGDYKIGSIAHLSSIAGRGLIFSGYTDKNVTTAQPTLVLSGYTKDLTPNNHYDAAVSVRGYDIDDNSTLQNIPIFKVLNGASATYLTVNANGSVGVGTLKTGSHKLAVEGSIGAREVKVQASGWSDFVFEKNYDLPSLEEVANHIAQKGHLKDIPSAAEVEKEGVFLGEMDAKLLQKIEELTLYTIEQEEKIDAQNQVIQKISKKLEILEHMVKTYNN